MIERDYILRMINLLVNVLARVLFHKKAYEFPQAKKEIDGAYRSMLGVGSDFIHQFSDEQLIDLVSKDPNTAGVKCYILGVLIMEEADIQALEADEGLAAELNEKALSLLLTGFMDVSGAIEPEHPKRIGVTIDRLRGLPVPVPLRVKLFSYFELIGKYDKAEDQLFEILESDTTFAGTGLQFYDRLLSKSDEELSKGNLPRQEIQEGKAKLVYLLHTAR